MYALAKHPAVSQPFTPLTDCEFFFFVRLGREDLLAAYIELKRYCWTGKNLCWPSEERQAGDTGRQIATVRRRLQQLEKLGVIRVLHSSESKRRGNRYMLTQPEEWQFPPDWIQEKPAPTSSPDPDRRRSADPDRPRSPKQIEVRKPDREETNKQGPIVPWAGGRAPAADAQPAAPDVVDSSGLTAPVLERLKALGAAITPSFLSAIDRSNSQALNRALACLEAARKVENPTGYFLAALKGNWSAPATFVDAQARYTAEAQSRLHLARTDELARIWGCRVGMDLTEIVLEIRRDLSRFQQPPAERVSQWVELGRSREKAQAIESEHDARVRAAQAATVAAGLQELVADN